VVDKAHQSVKVDSGSIDPWSPFNVRDSAIPIDDTGKVHDDTMSVGTTKVAVSEEAWSNTATAGGENTNGR
jgi:hypothetical protein